MKNDFLTSWEGGETNGKDFFNYIYQYKFNWYARLTGMNKIMLVTLITGLLICGPAAGDKKARNAAMVGGGVGLVTGGVSGAAKGALLGGGAGALASDDKGSKTNKYAGRGAAVGAGVGLVTDGFSGAAKGALYGGAAGAVTGRYKDKK